MTESERYTTRLNTIIWLLLGAVYTANNFTLIDVSSAHGSDANAGCPSACAGIVSGVRVCDCVGVTTDRTGIAVIDGVVPMLDVSQPNWATQLYTATTTRNTCKIDFHFPLSFMLRHVDFYLFFCPYQNIPNQGVLSISVYQSILFPYTYIGLLLGNITLSGEGQTCIELIPLFISTSSASLLSSYLIEFSMENVLGGVFNGEVVFTDEIATVTSSKLLKSCNA